MIDGAGFDPLRITAEVTESGLIEDLGVAAERLAELRARGFRVAIDDFGTADQLALLAEQGYELYQGFLFSPPVDAATLETLMD